MSARRNQVRWRARKSAPGKSGLSVGVPNQAALPSFLKISKEELTTMGEELFDHLNLGVSKKRLPVLKQVRFLKKHPIA